MACVCRMSMVCVCGMCFKQSSANMVRRWEGFLTCSVYLYLWWPCVYVRVCLSLSAMDQSSGKVNVKASSTHSLSLFFCVKSVLDCELLET